MAGANQVAPEGARGAGFIGSHTCLVLLAAGHNLVELDNVSNSSPEALRRVAGPRHSFQEGLAATVRWTLDNLDWCQRVRDQGGYSGGRLGVVAGA